MIAEAWVELTPQEQERMKAPQLPVVLEHTRGYTRGYIGPLLLGLPPLELMQIA
jgi:hypothetical protein